MKRAVSIFLAFYLALITCYPCSDEQVCESTTPGTAFYSADHSDLEQGTDLCSPLCICSCCSTSINAPRVFSFNASLPANGDLNAVLDCRDVAIISLSIWQPPKLA